ncbi:VOC family protein [Cryptosporangium phraense]|uniref:VOC family protein n=1 Tax=Cryptosporangium phraense TaxID=2593070 RepID=A0A545B093_9ACTN|nr:VOC family protein [Cryptosporangium phraense]TQS46991.1 VOC family protein [Cryptosporangium phraense]
MKAADQFHVGIVVHDLAEARERLTALFGYEWAPEAGGVQPVLLADGPATVDLLCQYSRSVPRVELVRSVPGRAIWQPADSGVHHVGYWSDDVRADSDALVAQGYQREVAGTLPDGTPYWAYHRPASGGPRIELVSRALQPSMERLWS